MLALAPTGSTVDSTNIGSKMFRKKGNSGTSLMVQWLRIYIAMHRTQVQSLVQENSTATKPACHNC